MKFGSTNKEIFKLAVPNILSNVTIPFLGMVDTALMGHEPEVGTVLITAVGIGALVFNGIYWNLGFLRVGTTGLTAQAFGRKDERAQGLLLFRSLIIASLFAILILLLKVPIRKYVFSWLATNENTTAIKYAIDYFDVRILAAPAVMAIYSLRGWFYGVQNAVFPMILLTILNVINIAASIYFVKVLGLGVKGVAWGTVLAQYVALFLAVGMILFKYQKVFKFFKLKWVLARKELMRFLNVNSNILGRNILLYVVFAFFTWYSSTVNETYAAMNLILLELFYFMSFAVDGFAYAAESLVGKYVGSGQLGRIKNVVKRLMVWGLGFGVLYAVAYFFFGKTFVGLFSNDAKVIASAQPFILWLCVVSIVGAVAFIWDGVYGGATLVTEMLVSMFLATLSFFIIFFLLKNQFGGHAIWIAMIIYMAIRGLGQWFLFNRFVGKAIEGA